MFRCGIVCFQFPSLGLESSQFRFLGCRRCLEFSNQLESLKPFFFQLVEGCDVVLL